MDLHTLTGKTTTIEKGVGALLAMPREHLLAEMEDLDRRRKLPASVGDIPALHLDLRDKGAAPRLMFPAANDEAAVRHLWSGDRSAGKALAALLGRTRAAALSSIADGCTTAELARRVGISIGAASQHATVLRETGLITTRRNGSAVLHVLTPLGAELLQAGRPPSHPAALPRHHRR